MVLSISNVDMARVYIRKSQAIGKVKAFVGVKASPFFSVGTLFFG